MAEGEKGSVAFASETNNAGSQVEGKDSKDKEMMGLSKEDRVSLNFVGYVHPR
jgi:hypothetical protein